MTTSTRRASRAAERSRYCAAATTESKNAVWAFVGSIFMRLAMASGTWLVRSLTSLGDGPMEKIETASLGRGTYLSNLEAGCCSNSRRVLVVYEISNSSESAMVVSHGA